MLGALLFLIYTNDEGMEGQIINFADDSKLYRAIKNEQYADALQKDIDQIEQWSSK